MNKSTLLSEETIMAKWPSLLDGHLHYCIALSGGIDSVVLLYLFNRIRSLKPINLSAIHVNHGISPNSDQWQEFCCSTCQKLNIPLAIASLKVTKIAGQGLENSARKARYHEFQKYNADVMVLAHHQNDQIETMLSQLMRGSDVHNQAAMHKLSRKQGQYYWRPLLDASKTQIRDYAAKHGLTNIEDESNQDCSYLRNFLRHRILPEMSTFDPQIISKLAKAVESIQEAVMLNDELAQDDYQKCCSTANSGLVLREFASLSQLRQINLINYYIRKHDLPLPARSRVREFIRQALSAADDRHPQLSLSKEQSLVRHAKAIRIRVISKAKITG